MLTEKEETDIQIAGGGMELDEAIENLIEARIRKLGVEIVKCSKCGKEMIWLKGKSGKSLPICLNLINHFVDCPFADSFKK